MKIVLIGAGSRSFGRGQVADILQATELQERQVTLTLVDDDHTALDMMARFAARVKAHVGTDITLERTTDRRAALPGADFVITAVARQRMPLWEQDFRVPLAYGFRHCLGENGGPGALFHALRSFELILPICHDIEACCPDALLLNFTNPEARVLHAICRLTRVKAIGICHGVYSAIEAVARYLNRPAQELEVVSAGMNHFYCLLSVRDLVSGEERLPEAFARALEDTTAPPLFRAMAEIFGVFTFPSDDHIGEYLSFGAEFHGVKWPYGQESRRVAAPTASAPSFEDYADGGRPLDAHILRPSGEVTVPIIGDIALDRSAFRPAVNVLNTARYISNLPEDGVVEVPALVDAQGVHPRTVGALPEPLAAYIRTQFTIISLVTEAYRTRSKPLLLQALLLDPTVNSITAARALLDEMLSLQRDFLPTFAARMVTVED